MSAGRHGLGGDKSWGRREMGETWDGGDKGWEETRAGGDMGWGETRARRHGMGAIRAGGRHGMQGEGTIVAQTEGAEDIGRHERPSGGQRPRGDSFQSVGT